MSFTQIESVDKQEDILLQAKNALLKGPAGAVADTSDQEAKALFEQTI